MSPISEDELRARLRDVPASPSVPGYAEVLVERAQARRRRQRWVSGLAVAAAVAAVALGALVVGDRIGREDALPATPTPTPTFVEPTPTASPTSTPSATSTPTPRPTSTPSATPGRTSAPPRSGAPTPSATPPRTTAPVAFLHEGVKGDGETTSDWVRTSTITGPCDVDAMALAARRGAVERRALAGGGGDGGATGEALVVFGAAGDAVSFMGELRFLARNCTSATGGSTAALVEDLPGPWGEGLAFTQFPNHDAVGGGPVGLAVRSGKAVAMSTSAGPFNDTTRVDPGLVESALPGVRHLYPQLCRYTQAGC